MNRAHRLPLDWRLPWWPSEGEEKTGGCSSSLLGENSSQAVRGFVEVNTWPGTSSHRGKGVVHSLLSFVYLDLLLTHLYVFNVLMVYIME